MIISKIFQTSFLSFILINQINRINSFFLTSKFRRPFFSKFIKYFFCSSSGILSMSIWKSFLIGSLDSINHFSWSLIVFICFLPWSSIVFICFSNALPTGECVNLASSITCLWLEGNIFSPVRYSYLSLFWGDKADFLLLLC